jgi:bud emergence protein 1
VPPSINLAALLDKVRERLGGEVSHVRYRDEGNARLSQGQMQSLLSLPGGARLVELRNDRELDDWIKGAQRLVAYVD